MWGVFIFMRSAAQKPYLRLKPNNQITLEGFRSTVEIDKAGGMMMGTLRAQIYGVSESNMKSITTLQWKPNAPLIPNTIAV